MTIDDIAREAELLPEAERVRLVERLIAEFLRSGKNVEGMVMKEDVRQHGTISPDVSKSFPARETEREKNLLELLDLPGTEDIELEIPPREISSRTIDFD